MMLALAIQPSYQLGKKHTRIPAANDCPSDIAASDCDANIHKSEATAEHCVLRFDSPRPLISL